MRWSFAGKALGDVLIINGAYFLAFLIRFEGILPEHNWEAFLAMSPWITVAALGLFFCYGLYSSGRYRFEEMFAGITASVIVLFVISIALSYMLSQFEIPRTIFIIVSPLQLLLLIVWRRFLWFFSRSRRGPLRMVVVGSLSQAVNRAKQLKHNSDGMFEVTGIVTDVAGMPVNKTDEEFEVLASYSDMAAVFDKTAMESLLLCSDVPKEVGVSLVLQAEKKGLPLFIIPDMYDILISQSKFEQIDGIPVLRLTDRGYDPSFLWKRLTDIALALFVGFPSIPVLLLAALAMKLESPHAGVIFRQQRVGRNGRTFELLKLRTMVPDAEELTGPILATKKDPRITRIGRLLRLMRIDELPQLLNVLKGDMSFVGPRPERPFFVDKFCREIEGYAHRHNINVGITGLAQVAGKYDTSAEDKLLYDFLYVKTKSPVKDFIILLHTIKTVLIRGKAL